VNGNNSNGTSIPFQNLSAPAPISFTALDTGFYNFWAFDDNGCVNDTTISITFQSPIPSISFNISLTQPFSTPGFGSITIQNIQGNITPHSNLQISVFDPAINSYPITGLVCNNLTLNTYSVTVTDPLTTMSHTEIATLQFQDLAIDDQKFSDITISNIERGTIQIVGLTLNDQYSIYNSLGQKIESKIGEELIKTSNLTSGIYIITIDRNNTRKSYQAIIKYTDSFANLDAKTLKSNVQQQSEVKAQKKLIVHSSFFSSQ
jgi:hypothetical protein